MDALDREHLVGLVNERDTASGNGDAIRAAYLDGRIDEYRGQNAIGEAEFVSLEEQARAERFGRPVTVVPPTVTELRA